MGGLIVTIRTRLRWLTIANALGFAIAAVLTRKLWLGDRLYPLTPVFAWLPDVPYPIDHAVHAALIGLNVLVAVMPRPRPFIIAAVSTYLVYSLWDQQRWIPFFNEIAAFYLILSFYRWPDRDDDEGRKILNGCGIVLVGIYLWSGIQKLNHNFFAEVFPWMMRPFMPLLPEALHPYVIVLAVPVPFLEIALGLGLLTRRFRKAAIAVGLFMHTFILLSAGPLGNDGNVQIWFWNVVSMILILLVFWNNDTPLVGFIKNDLPIVRAAAVFFGVLPMLNFVNLPIIGHWDDFQSATLYSGNTGEVTIYVPRSELGRVPEVLRDLMWVSDETGEIFLRGKDWGYRELNLPDYHARRIHENIGRRFCEITGGLPGAVIEIGGKSDAWTGERPTERLTCRQLAE